MFSEIAQLIVQLLKLVSLLHQHYNDPAQVAAKIKQMTVNAADEVDRLQGIIQDPNASKQDKDKAFERIRILGS